MGHNLKTYVRARSYTVGTENLGTETLGTENLGTETLVLKTLVLVVFTTLQLHKS